MAEEQVAMKPLLILTKDTVEFTANGNEYEITSQISYDRWIAFQREQINLAMGITAIDFFNKLEKQYELLNQQKLADAIVLCSDMMRGLANISDKRIPTALKICALVINRKGEDIRVYNEELINAKINDWRIEGIDMKSFFNIALNIIPGFIPTYKRISKSVSKDARN